VNRARAAAILAFWFGDAGDADCGKRRKAWFSKSPEFDSAIGERFLEDYRLARAGGLDDWRDSPETCLALILLLDQFPRNMFRGTPEAFAADVQALALARHAVERGFDRMLPPEQRMFVYLPFEHSESIADQRRCVELMQGLRGAPGLEDVSDFAQRHLRVIERFGRFPHRNAIQGRESSPEEIEFLRGPGSRF
jgi:uncharacterized protein (DUF924 family)